MADPNLTEGAWQRAARTSAHLYKTTAFGVAATLMTIIFGSVAAVASAGHDTTTQIAAPILGGALALALTFAVLFVVQLGAAPVRQRNELRAAWDSPPIKTVKVGLTLRDFHRKGTELLHRFGSMQYGIGRPELEETVEWADGVVAFLSEHAPEESTKAFIAAGQGAPQPLTQLEIRLGVLQGIIDEVG
jgi:hypothetical protein